MPSDTFLKRKRDGDLYLWTPMLAARKDESGADEFETCDKDGKPIPKVAVPVDEYGNPLALAELEEARKRSGQSIGGILTDKGEVQDINGINVLDTVKKTGAVPPPPPIPGTKSGK